MKNVISVLVLGLFLSLFFGVMGVASAADVPVFDPLTNTLTLPIVQVGEQWFGNVSVILFDYRVTDFTQLNCGFSPPHPLCGLSARDLTMELYFNDDPLIWWDLEWKPDCGNVFGPVKGCD